MSLSFKTILVPVDFSLNTEVGIAKAMEVADKSGALIILYHMLVTGSGSSSNRQALDQAKAAQQLEEWKHKIEDSGHLKARFILATGTNVQEGIVQKSNELMADLVVIGKSSAHSWFPFLNTITLSDLSDQTSAAVLVTKPGSINNPIKTIVVPVDGSAQQQKMQALAALGKMTRIRVHLVTFNTDDQDNANSTAPLLQVYQWLTNHLHCPVDYVVLQGYNKTRTLVRYAEKIGADILLVHPRQETRMGWLNCHISDHLPAESGVQVLAVQPEKNL
jgi:nucleotide-binding universal stress UspA family protein